MAVDVVDEVGMIVEDSTVELKRDEGKKKRKEKRKKGSVVEDVSVKGMELEEEMDRKGERGKKRKLDSESNRAEEDVVKEKKKKKRRKVDGSCESGEGGEDVEVELGRNDEVNISVRVEDGEVEGGKREKKKKETRENKKRDESVVDDEERNEDVQTDGLLNSDLGDAKKRKKRKKQKDGTENCAEEDVEVQLRNDDEVNISVRVEDGEVEVGKIEKKKKKTRKNKKTDESVVDDEERNEDVQTDGLSNSDSGDAKKRKKRKKQKDETEKCAEEVLVETVNNEDTVVDDKEVSSSDSKEKREKSRKSKKKKAKSIKDGKEKDVNEEETSTQNKEKNADGSQNRKSKKSSKHVKFSDKDEIFPLPEGSNAKNKTQKEGLVRGKRFTMEEDEILRKAVLNYIQEHDLGEDGVQKVMKCHEYPETRNCWNAISLCMPWRPKNAIYNRGHILFERDEKQSWTPEEIDLLKEFHAKYGPDWRKFADEYGKSRIHTKDAWRRVGNPNRKLGAWSQEEYQKYFDLVNMDLRMKVFTEKKIKHGMLKDNIAWEAISSKLDTRSNSDCCRKWYGQMQSPLVKAEQWANSDDFRLIIELSERDYSSVEEVDWDNILDHRPGEICRKRWHQMVRYLGEHGNKSFADQVEVLMKRYCPDVLEPRQIYEDKVPVDLVD